MTQTNVYKRNPAVPLNDTIQQKATNYVGHLSGDVQLFLRKINSNTILHLDKRKGRQCSDA